jgi:serine/threonine protein kinase
MMMPQENQFAPLQETSAVTVIYQLQSGEYTIQSVLAQGRWSTIYLASHITLSLPLAIKRFHTSLQIPTTLRSELDMLLRCEEESAPATTLFSLPMITAFAQGECSRCFEEFVREALFLARVRHPALPMLYDYFFEDDSWFLVMDYIPGKTLRAYLDEKGTLPPLEALDYALQLCSVLEYLHTQTPAIVFSALQPENVLLLPDHTIALIDFGHAHYEKERTSVVRTDQSTSSHEVLSQMIPGHIGTQEFYDPRTDLYSLGRLLYRMLLQSPEAEQRMNEGHEPLLESLEMENILQELPQRASGIPSEGPIDQVDETDLTLPALHVLNPAVSRVLSGLVKLAVCNDPLQRFQSARTFFLALARAFAIEECRLAQPDWGQIEEAAFDSDDKEILIRPVMEGKRPLPVEQRLQLRRQFIQLHREQYVQESWSFSQTFSPTDQLLSCRHRPSLIRQRARVRRVDGVRFELPKKVIATYTRQTIQHIIYLCFIMSLLIFLLLLSVFLYAHNKAASDKTPARISPPTLQYTPDALITKVKWQILPSLLSPEADNTAVYVTVAGRPYIYMSGGYRHSAEDTLPGESDYDRRLYRYDIEAAHWDVVNDHFPGWVNNAATVDEQGTIFFTTGYSSDTHHVLSVLWQYQPTSGALRKILPPTTLTFGFGSALLADQQGHLYLSQGFLTAGNPHTQAGRSWYRYNIIKKKWHQLSPMPVGLGYAVLALDDADGILLLGGSSDAGQQKQSDKMYRYDIARNSWSQLPTVLPWPVSGESACAPYPDMLALIGGVDPVRLVGTNNVLLLDLRTLHSSPLPAFPAGGTTMGNAVCDGAGHLFLLRGTVDLKSATRDFWMLTISHSLLRKDNT